MQTYLSRRKVLLEKLQMAHPGHPLQSPLGIPAIVTFHLSDWFVTSLQQQRELV